MNSKFLPFVNIDKIKDAKAAGNDQELYDLFAQPLHEELYKRQDFDFLDELSEGQQLLITYDYLRTQVGQGGFIQFIENGYVGLLPGMIEQLQHLGALYMAKVLDDVLKVYVLNQEIFKNATTIEDFARLYDELREFEEIEERFNKLDEPTTKFMLNYALGHLDDFISY